MRQNVIALLLSSTSAIQRHHHHHRRSSPTRHHYFATGMNGDEDLGQDITMKGEKFHYNQEPELLGLDGFAFKSAQKNDIRGPTTDGPTAGVYQWPTPAPAMAPIPGPYGKTTSFSQKKAINHAEHTQSVAGTDVTDQTSDVVHTIAMKAADAHPATNRDAIGKINNMWSYPKNLDPELEPKAHIYGEGVNKEVKESEDAQAAKDKAEVKETKDKAKAQKQEDAKEPVANAAEKAPEKAAEKKEEKKADAKKVEKAVEDAKQTQKEGEEKAKEASLAQKQSKWDIDNTPRQGDRDYVTAKMWTYPKNQTPDPHAPKNGPSEDDIADAEKARVAAEAKGAEATAKKDAQAAADKAKADLKKDVAAEKAKAKAAAASEKASSEAAVKNASLAQTKDHDEGHVDMAFLPHPILPNTLHNDQMQKIDSVAGPVASDKHLSESVHRSAMEGGDANPDQSRSLIKNFPMFSYPQGQTAPAAPNALPVEDAPSVTVDPAKVEASKAARAKEAEADKKEEAKQETAKAPVASLAQKKDIEGHSDPHFLPHPILPNTLHNDQMQKIDSVAGPEVTDEHMSETVHRSAMEGGEPNPEARRDLVVKGYNPSFDASTQASTNPASSGDAAELQSVATSAAKKAKEAAEKAASDEKMAKLQAAADKAKAEVAASKAKKASLAQKKDIEGPSDPTWQPHAILPNTLFKDAQQKISSVAGPAVTDQIGESVHKSAVEGGDPNPDASRSILGNHPASFTPDYSKSTTKSAGDVASAEFKAKGDAINAKAAEKAAEAAKVEAEQRANSERKVHEDIAELKKAEPKTLHEKEANAEKLKKLEDKAAANQEAHTKEAVAGAVSVKADADVTLLKTKNKK